MNKSESIIELAKALVKFHSVMGKVSKDAANPFFKNKYASLSNIIEAVTKPLNDNGLSILQLPSIEGLTTLLLHESGEWISSVSATPVKDATDPQKLGSAITYARRYALGAILSLNIDEDDDGQKAATAPPKKQAAPVPKSERVIVADGDELFLKIVKAVSDGKATIQQALNKYNISDKVEASLKAKIQALTEIV
jgi:hypothetical protein